MPFEQELQTALAAEAAASTVVMDIYERFEAIPDAHHSITTEADYAAQDVIVDTIRQKFPDDGIHAEEDRPNLRDAPVRSDRFWVIDPIDGSRGFARKNGEFSIMIGLVIDGAPVLGVVGEPVPQRITWAWAGGGCHCRQNGTDRQVTVRNTPTVDQAMFIMSRGSRITDAEYKSHFGVSRIIRAHSAGLKLAAVARGEVDAYVSGYHNYQDYDMCAGHILVSEAGGRVTDFYGDAIAYPRPGTAITNGVVATNGRLHAEILRATHQRPRTAKTGK